MKFCPRCHQLEGSNTCVMESLPGFVCPAPVEEDANTVVIHCAACNFTRGVPVGNLLQGLKGDSKLPVCKRDDCQAKVLHPQEYNPAPADPTSPVLNTKQAAKKATNGPKL